jgi:hypothetical protein
MGPEGHMEPRGQTFSMARLLPRLLRRVAWIISLLPGNTSSGLPTPARGVSVTVKGFPAPPFPSRHHHRLRALALASLGLAAKEGSPS